MNTLFKDQLAQYQAAVVTVSGGGSVTVYGRSFSSSNVAELYLRERLARFRVAEQAILEGAQSYQIDNRSLARGDLNWISEQIADLEARVSKTERGGGIRLFQAVPR